LDPWLIDKIKRREAPMEQPRLPLPPPPEPRPKDREPPANPGVIIIQL
jgi:hypothetical protein